MSGKKYAITKNFIYSYKRNNFKNFDIKLISSFAQYFCLNNL